MTILDQLYDIYETYEYWHTSRLTRTQFDHYTQKLIDQGNIFYVQDGDKIVGYTEVWKINYSQFGRLLCVENIIADGEDVLNGNIAYVANVFIDPLYRQKFGHIDGVIKKMRKQYFEFTENCQYHVGEAKRKSTGLVKVFKAKGA